MAEQFLHQLAQKSMNTGFPSFRACVSTRSSSSREEDADPPEKLASAAAVLADAVVL
jgi:hypothetical protein